MRDAKEGISYANGQGLPSLAKTLADRLPRLEASQKLTSDTVKELETSIGSLDLSAPAK